MSNYVLTANGQLYHCDVSESELYHYGVPGMKWGQRKAAYATEKGAYKQAKKAYKAERKNLRKASGLIGGVGIKGIAKVKAAEKKATDAEFNMIDAKAKYKAAKSKNSAKAEFNTYRKEMQKTGLAGSSLDDQNSGRSTNLYNHIKRTKGKEYADKVQKKVQNVAVKQLVGAATVAVGSAVVVGILEARS